MLHIFDSTFSYVLVMARYCELPLFSMTAYVVAQKQHRFKKIIYAHKECINIFIMYSMHSQKTAGDPWFSEAKISYRFLLFIFDLIISVEC